MLNGQSKAEGLWDDLKTHLDKNCPIPAFSGVTYNPYMSLVHKNEIWISVNDICETSTWAPSDTSVTCCTNPANQKPIYLAALFIAPCCLSTETLGGSLLFRLSFPPSLVHFLPSFLPVGLVRPLISACTVIGMLTCLQLVWQAARQQCITHMNKCNLLCVNLIKWIKNTSFCCNILHPCFGSVNASVWTLDGAVGAAVRRHQNVSLCEFEKWH